MVDHVQAYATDMFVAIVGAEIGKDGPGNGKILVRGEPGWEIVADLQPLFGEPIVDKPGTGAFYATGELCFYE